jgi:hypothetical protein
MRLASETHLAHISTQSLTRATWLAILAVRLKAPITLWLMILSSCSGQKFLVKGSSGLKMQLLLKGFVRSTSTLRDWRRIDNHGSSQQTRVIPRKIKLFQELAVRISLRVK